MCKGLPKVKEICYLHIFKTRFLKLPCIPLHQCPANNPAKQPGGEQIKYYECMKVVSVSHYKACIPLHEVQEQISNNGKDTYSERYAPQDHRHNDVFLPSFFVYRLRKLFEVRLAVTDSTGCPGRHHWRLTSHISYMNISVALLVESPGRQNETVNGHGEFDLSNQLLCLSNSKAEM